MDKLQKNKEYVEKNYDSLLKTYANKYIVVANQEVVGSFDSYHLAADFGIENYGIEKTFLIEFITQEKPINFVMGAQL